MADKYPYLKLTDRIADSKQSRGPAIEWVKKHGAPNPKTNEELKVFMAKIMKTDGEKALAELAEIHPDRNLILETCKCRGKKRRSSAEGDEEQPTKPGTGGFLKENIGTILFLTTIIAVVAMATKR